jgi:hypothetical protein
MKAVARNLMPVIAVLCAVAAIGLGAAELAATAAGPCPLGSCPPLTQQDCNQICQEFYGRDGKCDVSGCCICPE